MRRLGIVVLLQAIVLWSCERDTRPKGLPSLPAPRGADTSIVRPSPPDSRPGCTYPSQRLEGSLEFSDISCFRPDGAIQGSILSDLHFGTDQLSFFMNSGTSRVYYIRKDGAFRETFWFDNGPDYFQNGLARVIVEGKFGFMDSTLEIRILPQWDFVHPFVDGVALAGFGCTTQRVDSEHSAVGCDSTLEIDTQGNPVQR